ncbi:hypothetical protein NQK81_01450 [Amycolatopsis roodepoortensis]|uniref:hypothetical protein n=1 Tax=Amycolatopsis roodepoortensis TaxID=700274 RepID=UPI00214CC66B|nr:hypothetical protein [Amycolatopsis roodepoortensis]UUV32141.1 hypothetical protein NQK81_01450 [Amycolatopsis roodepoortensis]
MPTPEDQPRDETVSIINPGSEAIPDALEERAGEAMRAYFKEVVGEAPLEQARVRRASNLDENGRFGYVLTLTAGGGVAPRDVDVLMPGLPVDVLRQAVLRMYVDGSSWMWPSGVNVGRRMINEELGERSLHYGYDAGLPDERRLVRAAWGARAVITETGGIDLLPDRQTAFGPKRDVDELLANLNLDINTRWTDRATSLLSTGEMSSKRAGEFILVADRDITVKANTKASNGYLYVCAYPTPLAQSS